MFEFITNFLEKSGYIGVFLLMALGAVGAVRASAAVRSRLIISNLDRAC